MIRPSSELTHKYFEEGNHKVGDILTEMFSFWIWIVNITDDKIDIIEGNNNLKILSLTKEDFKNHCSYKHTVGKYWIDFTGNNLSTTKAVLSYYKSQFQDKRDLKIEEIIYNI